MADLALHLELAVWLLVARRMLHRRGLEPTLHRLGDGRARWGHDIPAARVAAAARRVERVVGQGTCLEEAVAVAAVLARHGHRPEIVVGGRRATDGNWAAHAWTLVDEMRLDQAPNVSHTPLAAYAAATGWRGQPLGE